MRSRPKHYCVNIGSTLSDLRERFFEHLSATGKLDAEFTSIKSASPANPAAQQFVAEASAWKSHFEEAAPAMQAMAADFPADAGLAEIGPLLSSARWPLMTRQATFITSRIAAAIERKLTLATPRDNAALTRLGEIYADRELFSRAKPAWDRIAQIQPGTSERLSRSRYHFLGLFPLRRRPAPTR